MLNELACSIEIEQMFFRFMYFDTVWLPALSRPQVNICSLKCLAFASTWLLFRGQSANFVKVVT